MKLQFEKLLNWVWFLNFLSSKSLISVISLGLFYLYLTKVMCSITIYKNSYNNHNFPIFRRRNMDLLRRRKTNEDIVYQSVWTNYCPCKPGLRISPKKKGILMRIFSVQMYFVYKYMYNVNQLHFLKHHITWKLFIYSIPLPSRQLDLDFACILCHISSYIYWHNHWLSFGPCHWPSALQLTCRP